jgi:hypothetical protein
LTEEERVVAIKDLVDAYQELLLVERDGCLDEKERENLLTKQNEAYDSLNVIFQGHREELKGVLDICPDNGVVGYNKTIKQLKDWLREFQLPTNKEDERWSSSAESQIECTKILRQFEKDGIWPFVKVLK